MKVKLIWINTNIQERHLDPEGARDFVLNIIYDNNIERIVRI
jgi:hypothetical protein